LVHRLDRNVGGTMIFAKTSKGASRLSEEMRRARFRKGYFALAEGRFDAAAGTEGVLIHHLYKDEKRNIVTDDPKRGKESVLAYRIVGVWKNYTVVFAVPITGRTHQIRAQLAFSGHPLVDDVKYGGTRVTTGTVSYPALWSAMICVKHPTSAEILDFRSAPYPMQPWNPAVIGLCDNFLKGFHHDELDRLYGLWH
ncbi:RluA family pseudouridine synthase, partial [Ruthenibacterium lactatiformans]|uniref:RluA family pseudouridine synthase n=1 Tax=Ruthenibacterium lactatiformans TaxID=1550024 RepID=UPI002664F60F